MESTAKALIEHWGWASERGVMNANTAGALRAACAKVLSIYDDLEATDVRELDVEDALRRFKNLRGKDLKPHSIEAYEQRFRQAHKSFLQYLDDPGAWKPTTRQPERNGRAKPKDRGNQHAPAGAAIAVDVDSGRAVDYPFPLREGFVAHMVLPTDLKDADIRRLTTFMTALVVNDN